MAMEGTVQTIEVDASPQHVFEVALDLDAYPEWVGGVESVEILEYDDEDRPLRVHFVAEAMVRRIEYTLVYEYDLHNGFSWHAEPGRDVKAMDGTYEFNELEDGTTEVVYSLHVDTTFSVPGFLRRQAERHIVGSALRGLKKRAESL